MEQVTKKRIMAIIGIVLPILGGIVETIGEHNEVEPMIRVSGIIMLCAMIYGLFYYSILLKEGIKNKFKTITITTIIGLVFCVLGLIGLIVGSFLSESIMFRILIAFSGLSILYLVIFSIVMLVKTFKKSK